MYCGNCGQAVSNGAAFCSGCGAANPNYAPPAVCRQTDGQAYRQTGGQAGRPSDGNATLIIGVISCVPLVIALLAGFFLPIIITDTYLGIFVGLMSMLFAPVFAIASVILGLAGIICGVRQHPKSAAVTIGLILSVIGLLSIAIFGGVGLIAMGLGW